MKRVFIIIKNEKFENILKYAKFISKNDEKYFILCTSNITNEIKEYFNGENCTFFRNTLPQEYLNKEYLNKEYSCDKNSDIFTSNSIYASMLFAKKILERNNEDISSNITLFSKIENANDIRSFKYLLENYLNIKYLYIR